MKVLLAVDQSRDAKVAARFLETVRFPRGSELSMLHVIEVPYVATRYPVQAAMLADWRKEAAAGARRLIDTLAQPFRAQGLPVCPLLKEGLPGPALLHVIERRRVDLAVLSPHRYPRIVRFLLGSVSELLLNDAPCSVLVVRGTPRLKTDRGLRVILATDFSPDADAAAALLLQLELPQTSKITVFHVQERADDVMARIGAKGQSKLHQAIEAVMRKRRRQATRLLERLRRRLARRGCGAAPLLRDGNPAEEIIRAASRLRADLVVLGSRGLTGFTRILLGSVSGKVARHAPCSVLVVRRRG